MKRISCEMKLLAFVLFVSFSVGTRAVPAKVDKCAADFWTQQLDQLQSQLDVTVQPCDDFYEYACGNWRAPYPLRTLHARDTFTAMKADNKRVLMEYFEHLEAQQPSTAQLHPSLRSVENLYNSCLNERVRTEKSDGIKVYTNTLKQFSDWPILNASFSESSANTSFNWEHVSGQLRRYGVQSFWRLLVQSNWQAAEQKIFYIAPPSFEFLKHNQLAESYDEDSTFLYKRYVKYLLLDLGVRVRKAIKIADEVVEFEKSIMSLTINERLVVLKAPQTLAYLASELPELKLRHYFDTLLRDFSLPNDYADKLLIVADKEYLFRLTSFLKKSKAETIGKYLLVQFLAHFEVHLHEQDTFFEQKEDCLQQVQLFLPRELSKIFLQLQHGDSEAFLQSTQDKLNQIFEQLKTQFEKLLNTTNIFERDAPTKVLGLEKLFAMRLLLPKLGEISSSVAFEVGENYDLNVLNLSLIRTKQMLAEIVNSLNAFNSNSPNEFLPSAETAYGPLDVNAYYRLKKNVIEIPVGLLRRPIYDSCLKPAKIYGGFVYILAHEMLHGFDYDGLNYDKLGNVANNWGAKSIIKFGTKSSCYLTERYKNAPLTINENIADSEGLRLALETYMDTEGRAAVKEDDLKLFFISFAQTWCGVTAINSNAVHAGHRERVNNVVGNFPEFAETFKCRAGSEMHPQEKCRIW